jgi:hypothetical protein
VNIQVVCQHEVAVAADPLNCLGIDTSLVKHTKVACRKTCGVAPWRSTAFWISLNTRVKTIFVSGFSPPRRRSKSISYFQFTLHYFLPLLRGRYETVRGSCGGRQRRL